MSKTMSRIILCLSIIFYTPSALPIPATEGTQILNNFQLLQGTLEAIRTYQAIERDLKWAIINTKQYVTEFKRAPLLTFSRLFRVVQDEGGIAESLKYRAERLEQRYPGFLKYLLNNSPEQVAVVSGEFSRAVKEEVDSSMESIGINMEEVRTEAQLLEVLENDSLTAEGRLEALQVGHQIALTGLQQNVRLQKLIQEQIKLTQVFLKDRDNQRVHAEVENRKIAEGLGTDPYGSDVFCRSGDDCE